MYKIVHFIIYCVKLQFSSIKHAKIYAKLVKVPYLDPDPERRQIQSDLKSRTCIGNESEIRIWILKFDLQNILKYSNFSVYSGLFEEYSVP